MMNWEFSWQLRGAGSLLTASDLLKLRGQPVRGTSSSFLRFVRVGCRPATLAEGARQIWLNQGLNEPIQQNAIKAAIMPTNAVLVVFVEGVHEYLPLTQHQKGTPAYWSALPSRGRKGYQGRSPWLVGQTYILAHPSGRL
jgi:hypothetical protein